MFIIFPSSVEGGGRVGKNFHIVPKFTKVPKDKGGGTLGPRVWGLWHVAKILKKKVKQISFWG